MESFNGEKNKEESIDILDYEDSSFFTLLKQLPHELFQKHITFIKESNMNDAETKLYLEDILEKRKEAVTVSVISDENAQEMFQGHEEELFARIETDVFDSPDNLIGAGTTARIKRFDLKQEERTIPMALKYLVSPTMRTLSAAAEHDMIREVERIQHIEDLEKDTEFSYISVPHPYFHHKNQRIQCYGMQFIDGCDLNKTVGDMQNRISLGDFKKHMEEVNMQQLDQEIDIFFSKMHTYCLHGDIKPRNIMVDSVGKFFIIDFGQSVLVNDIPEKGLPQFEELKTEEVKATKQIIRRFIRQAINDIA
jgi:tRNA A-37 threonylcarbamoyl transferase component Bud32